MSQQHQVWCREHYGAVGQNMAYLASTALLTGGADYIGSYAVPASRQTGLPVVAGEVPLLRADAGDRVSADIMRKTGTTSIITCNHHLDRSRLGTASGRPGGGRIVRRRRARTASRLNQG